MEHRIKGKLSVRGPVKGFRKRNEPEGGNDHGKPGLTRPLLATIGQGEEAWDIREANDAEGYRNQAKLLWERVRLLEDELQRAREESFQAGYDEGREAGLKEAERQIEDVAREFEGMLGSLKEQYSKALEKMDEPLLKLARTLAEKVIGVELERRDELDTILLNQIHRLLREVVDQNRMIVRVNPDRLQWVTKKNWVEALKLPSTVEINFVGDRSLKPGECLLETEDYIVDGTFSSQLQYLEEQLMNGEI